MQPALLAIFAEIGVRERHDLVLGLNNFRNAELDGEAVKIVETSDDLHTPNTTSEIRPAIRVDQSGTFDAAITQKADCEFSVFGGPENKYLASGIHR